MVLLTSLMDRPPTTAVALRKPDGLPVDTVLCWHLRKNFAITVKHLEHVGTGTSEDATKARGMVKAIKTEKFVRFLYFLLHVTKILRELSLQFQSDYLFITEVSTKLETALTKLEGLKDSDPLPIAVTFQAKFQSNYNSESGLFKCGKDCNLDVVLNKGNAMEM